MDQERSYIEVKYNDEKLRLYGSFYEVEDWMGEPKRLIGLYLETPEGEPYTDLTVSFGEFVGAYGNFFPDVNNEPGVEKFLQDNLIAFPANGFKISGFVTYPAYRLSPYAMEKLFTLEEIRDYKLDYDFYGEATEDMRTSCEWAKESLDKEKKSFDEFLAERQGRA